MRFSSYALPALAANLVAALPRPQDIDLDMVLAAPDPTFSQAVGVAAQTVTYDTASLIAEATAAVSSVSVGVSDVLSQTAIATNAKRAAATTCAPQPAGATSAPTYAADADNAANFLANTYYASVASNAPIPTGYTQAFVAQQASNNAFGYMGFDTFDDYNVNTCAQRCTAKYGCVSFNIYFERDPSVNPDDASCSNPPSSTTIKCVYWGGQVTLDNAVNKGQMRGGFTVAIAGSNGYVTTQVSTPAGYQNGVPFGKFAINAPYDAQGYNTYMGAKIFTGTWDVSQCSNYCDAQTKYNLATAPKDGTPAKVCKFFNTYLLQAKLANGTIVPQGQYCSLYTEAWPIKYATNGGQWRGQDQYTVDYSFGYAKTASSSDIDPTVGDANGAKYQAVADIKWSSLQPFCSTYLGYTVPVSTVTATATITPVSTSTTYSTATVMPHRKRDDGNSTMYPGLSTDSSVGGLVLIDANGTSWFSEEVPSGGPSSPENADVNKRDSSVAIPAGLTKYQPAVISSACAMQVTRPTSTSTFTVSTTVTGAATTTVVAAISTVTADESAYFSVDQGTFNAAGAGYTDFYTSDTALFVNLRNTNFASGTYKARIAVDPNTGYLKDDKGRVAYIYTTGFAPGDAQAVRFYQPNQSSVYNQPLICTPPQGTASYSLSCTVTAPNGLVISNLIGWHNFNTGYSYLMMTASTNLAPYYGKAHITIFGKQ
ncbi:hypothetical protein KCU77_g801, partial [Aureobasidium melanogenum]